MIAKKSPERVYSRINLAESERKTMRCGYYRSLAKSKRYATR